MPTDLTPFDLRRLALDVSDSKVSAALRSAADRLELLDRIIAKDRDAAARAALTGLVACDEARDPSNIALFCQLAYRYADAMFLEQTS